MAAAALLHANVRVQQVLTQAAQPTNPITRTGSMAVSAGGGQRGGRGALSGANTDANQYKNVHGARS